LDVPRVATWYFGGASIAVVCVECSKFYERIPVILRFVVLCEVRFAGEEGAGSAAV
jgi:hypothetical protein